jgi:hypothetical protein
MSKKPANTWRVFSGPAQRSLTLLVSGYSLRKGTARGGARRGGETEIGTMHRAAPAAPYAVLSLTCGASNAAG